MSGSELTKLVMQKRLYSLRNPSQLTTI